MNKIRDGLRKLTTPSKGDVAKEIIFILILITIFTTIVYFGDKVGLTLIKEILTKR